jgi:hypothetical protein
MSGLNNIFEFQNCQGKKPVAEHNNKPSDAQTNKQMNSVSGLDIHQHLPVTAAGNRKRFSDKLVVDELSRPTGWTRQAMSAHEMLDFLPQRLLYGGCDWLKRIYVSVSPGQYRIHIGVSEGQMYDGQSELEAVTTQSLSTADVEMLAKCLGSDFKSQLTHPNQFSWFDPVKPVLTRSVTDYLTLTIRPKYHGKQIVSRLMYSRANGCDPERAIRPEPVLFAVDGEGRMLFARPGALLRHTCRSAWKKYTAAHDKIDHYFRYHVRDDQKLASTWPITHHTFDDAHNIAIGAAPTPATDMKIAERPLLDGNVQFFDSKQRLALAHTRVLFY